MFPVALPSALKCISSHMTTDVFSKFSGAGGSAVPLRGGKSCKDSLGNAGFVCQQTWGHLVSRMTSGRSLTTISISPLPCKVGGGEPS